MTIKSINLSGFKQFENFTITCRDSNILVGPNNSGKSTTLDALRICHDVYKFIKRRTPQHASQGSHGVCATYSLEQSSVSVSIDNIVRNYGEDDAEIKINHVNGNCLVIQLHPERRIKAYLITESDTPNNPASFKRLFPLDIIVVPTLGPLEDKEAYVTDITVQRNETTRLAHRNFRNIWLRKTDEEFNEFTHLVTSAWPDITVKKPKTVRAATPYIEMHYHEARIPREIFWSGFGFQVWMQMITQIMRGSVNSILVLDEPDIYLHPDLQRKLVKLVKERFGQVFIATHSTEIINEANPGDILLISKKYTHARRINTDDGYREIFSYLGSSENAEFARIARARRIIFFEGRDRRILQRFAKKLNRSSLLDDTDTIYLQSGGFGQWRRVNEVNWTLENMFGMNVKIGAVFDRDYHCREQIEYFKREINSENVRCHFLERKEIENYALNRATLVRTIKKRAALKNIGLEDSDSENLINEIITSLHGDARAQVVAKYLEYHKRQRPNIDDSTLILEGIADFESRWSNPDTRLFIIPGKDFISMLSAKLQESCGVSLTLVHLADEMRVPEIANDLDVLIRDLDHFFA